MADISKRDFRAKVSRLKKAGLVSSIDARKAEPWSIGTSGATGKRKEKLSYWVNYYDDFLSGKESPVKLSKSEVKARAKLGEKHVGDIVLVQHGAGEKAKLEDGHVVLKSASGIERVQIPIEYHNLEQYLRDIAKDTDRINAMKSNREWFAFQFHGNGSYSVYRSIDDLIEDLQRYESIASSINKHSAKEMREQYRNLVIFKVGKSSKWENMRSEIEHTRKQAYSHKRYVKRIKPARQGAPEWKKKKRLESNRQASQANRDKMTAKQKKEYKAAAKKRAKKSRESSKKKKG